MKAKSSLHSSTGCIVNVAGGCTSAAATLFLRCEDCTGRFPVPTVLRKINALNWSALYTRCYRFVRPLRFPAVSRPARQVSRPPAGWNRATVCGRVVYGRGRTALHTAPLHHISHLAGATFVAQCPPVSTAYFGTRCQSSVWSVVRHP